MNTIFQSFRSRKEAVLKVVALVECKKCDNGFESGVWYVANNYVKFYLFFSFLSFSAIVG